MYIYFSLVVCAVLGIAQGQTTVVTHLCLLSVGNSLF